MLPTHRHFHRDRGHTRREPLKYMHPHTPTPTHCEASSGGTPLTHTHTHCEAVGDLHHGTGSTFFQSCSSMYSTRSEYERADWYTCTSPSFMLCEGVDEVGGDDVVKIIKFVSTHNTQRASLSTITQTLHPHPPPHTHPHTHTHTHW